MKEGLLIDKKVVLLKFRNAEEQYRSNMIEYRKAIL